MFWASLFAAPALVYALPQVTPTRPPGSKEGDGGFSRLRFGCSQLVIERLDPLVNPSIIPSPHVHQIVGGNAFDASIASTDVSRVANCTTCGFADDFSNYWTANLYFQAQNGSYKRVPQLANRNLDGARGGITVYYISKGKGKTTAFKPGFRMLVGDSARRSKKGSGLRSQSCFRCYSGPNFKGDDLSPCADEKLDTEAFPTKPCLGGIRSNILFPTCWDGNNLDSPNHQDHVAYPKSGPSAYTTTSDCPTSHPVKLPQLMLEIVWDTTGFNDLSQWPEDKTKQPFRLSTGDDSGYGQHADYVFGWRNDALQKGMDGGCFGATCTGLRTQSFKDANQCTVKDTVQEPIDGWLDKLPGDGSGM
ncbi:hypothetical protein GQ53DRAFT_821519 [Thozetella sp. PMI_491]|nr:hypothetical protein GQ53DRAFT_821519 [Thozetella sp. PMI_491]